MNGNSEKRLSVWGDFPEINAEKSNFVSVFHYTKTDSFMNMVHKGNIWISHATCLNDPMEINYLMSAVRKNIFQRIKEKSEIRIFSEILRIDMENRNVANSLAHFGDFLGNDYENFEETELFFYILNHFYMKSYHERLIKNTKDHSGLVFIGSFIEESASESVHVWDMYGDKGRGVRLELNFKEFQNQIKESVRIIARNSSFYKVKYINKDKMEGFVDNLLNDYYDKYEFSMRNKKNSFEKYNPSPESFVVHCIEEIYQMSAIVKDDVWSFENEIRLLINLKNTKNIKFRTGLFGNIVPYLDIVFEKNNQNETGSKKKFFAKQSVLGKLNSISEKFEKRIINKNEYSYHNFLSEILLGPNQPSEGVYSAQLFLQQEGLKNCRVLKSSIKYR